MHSPKISITNDFLSTEESERYLKFFKSLSFNNINVKCNGSEYTPMRKSLSFANNGIFYTYSGHTSQPKDWTPEILELKKKVEDYTKEVYNYALIKFYKNGSAGVNMHRDNERELDPESSIPTISFGASRKMLFTCPNKRPHSIELVNGSLIVMDPTVNREWKHGIPVDASVKSPRYSITFRHIIKKQLKRKRINEKNFVDPILNEGKKFSIEEDIYVSVGPYQGDIKIHIRRFERGVVPTCDGVCMDLETFYYFLKNISNVTLVYQTDSFIANNRILALRHDNGFLLKEFTSNYIMKMNSIHLSDENLQIFKNKEHEIVDYILELLYEGVFINQLYKLDRNYDNVLNPTHEEECEMRKKFSEILHTSLINVSRRYVWCNGCANRHTSQIEHTCSTLSDSEVYSKAGEYSIILLDYKVMAKELANSNIINRANCLKKLTIDDIKTIASRIL